MRITIRLEDEEVLRRFQRLVKNCVDRGPALRQAGEALLESTKQRFSDMQDPEGHRWAPLSPATLQRKKLKDRILVESQQLFNSITYDAGQDHVEIGTNKEYAAALQFGDLQEGQSSRIRGAKRGPMRFVRYREANRGKGGMPARPFLGLSKGDRAAILRIFTAHLKKGVE